jgi:hypothetical protein
MEPTPVYIKEKWFTYCRIYCKQGFIDRLICDSANDPNLDQKQSFNLNSISTYYRLGGSSTWFVKSCFNQIEEIILNFKDISTSEEIWECVLN